MSNVILDGDTNKVFKAHNKVIEALNELQLELKAQNNFEVSDLIDHNKGAISRSIMIYVKMRDIV